MKTESLTLLLNWLKENNAHRAGKVIAIPVRFRELVIEIVGSNEMFKEELERNKISTSFLYNRILINREFAFNIEEPFWAEQFQVIQNQKVYFNNIKGRPIEPNESTDIQINEKIEALKKLEYLDKLSFHIESKMKHSSLWINHLTYLLGWSSKSSGFSKKSSTVSFKSFITDRRELCSEQPSSKNQLSVFLMAE